MPFHRWVRCQKSAAKVHPDSQAPPLRQFASRVYILYILCLGFPAGAGSSTFCGRVGQGLLSFQKSQQLFALCLGTVVFVQKKAAGSTAWGLLFVSLPLMASPLMRRLWDWASSYGICWPGGGTCSLRPGAHEIRPPRDPPLQLHQDSKRFRPRSTRQGTESHQLLLCLGTLWKIKTTGFSSCSRVDVRSPRMAQMTTNDHE